jgi:hypothetical protein
MDQDLKQYFDGKFTELGGKIADLNGKIAELDAKFATKRDLERVETALLTEFHKWASPAEMRARTHAAYGPSI